MGNTDILLNMELSFDNPEALLVKKSNNSLELNIPNFVLDLRENEEIIFKKIHKSTRADIRKASEKADLTYQEFENPNDMQLKEFYSLYNSFAREKNITLCNLNKLLSLRNNDSLIMTSLTDSLNNTLCTGMLLIDRECKQLYALYGLSHRLSTSTREDRMKIGRANKYWHWKEIQSAKKRGMDWYNFGGEVFQETGSGINDFKRRFGSICKYDRRVYIPKSLRGRVYVYLLYLKWKQLFKSHGQSN